LDESKAHPDDCKNEDINAKPLKEKKKKTTIMRHVLTFSKFPPSQSFSYRNQKSHIISIFRDREEETKAKTLTQRRSDGLFTTRKIGHWGFRNRRRRRLRCNHQHRRRHNCRCRRRMHLRYCNLYQKISLRFILGK
jgi:hypothetical protein